MVGQDGVMTCPVFLYHCIKPSNLHQTFVKKVWKKSSCKVKCYSDNPGVFFSCSIPKRLWEGTMPTNHQQHQWPDCHPTSSWDGVLLPDSNEAWNVSTEFLGLMVFRGGKWPKNAKRGHHDIKLNHNMAWWFSEEMAKWHGNIAQGIRKVAQLSSWGLFFKTLRPSLLKKTSEKWFIFGDVNLASKKGPKVSVYPLKFEE